MRRSPILIDGCALLLEVLRCRLHASRGLALFTASAFRPRASRAAARGYRMISSTFFFLFSQIGVGMMLTLLFISPRTIGNSFFKFASLTAAILLGVTLGFNFLFPSPVRDGQLPVVFLLASAGLTVIYNRVVAMEKFAAALALLIGATATG